MEQWWKYFDTREDGTPIPVCYKEASEYLVWEVKKNLTRKARCVKYGQKSDDPESLNFAGFITRNNIWSLFKVASLNVVHIWKKSFKLHIRKVALVKRAPYGVNHIRKYYGIHFRSCGSSFDTIHIEQIQIKDAGIR